MVQYFEIHIIFNTLIYLILLNNKCMLLQVILMGNERIAKFMIMIFVFNI